MLVEKFVPGGQAIGTNGDGKKVFLWNALPGEEVIEWRTIKKKSSYDEAIPSVITNFSPHRIQPKDTCFLSTSPWQIVDYNYELEQKSLLVQEIFREHDIIIDAPEVITDGKDYLYRNKMEYSLYFDHEDKKIHLAFHARGSHQKIKITSSSLERPEIFRKALEIIDDLNARHEEARKYQSLLLRCNQNGEVSGGLFENKKPHPVFDNLKDTILGHEYFYSPNGFFQINLPVYEMALEEIKKYIDTDEVLDLYAGVGTIGLSVARDKKLTLVEVDKSAYKELVNNSKDQNNVTTILEKSENVLGYIISTATVILDPPRAGIDKKLIDRLLEVVPPKIIYLSCNPATQARDLEALLAKYHIEDIKTYNFFPRTPHIENLVVLSL